MHGPRVHCTKIGLFSPPVFLVSAAYPLSATFLRRIKITILNWSEKRAHESLVYKALRLACSG